MEKQQIILNAIILFYIIQRISEMAFSNHNESILKKNNQAVEVNPSETLKMKLFHTLWFVGLIIESNANNTIQSDQVSIIIYLILGICLFVRMHTMEKLKEFWTIKVLSMTNQNIITNGLYKYLRHPNYLIVILEFMFIPLLFKAYWTLIIFSIINLIVLYQRIKLEEETLMSQSNYNKIFSKTKRLIPFIFFLILSFNTRASEIKIHSNDYEHAKNNIAFIKFESTSTKFGVFSSTFDGYARDIMIRYELTNNEVSKLEVEIPVKGLDTDNNARNEKMYNEVLDSTNHPTISVSSAEKISLQPGEKVIDMTFLVKGNKVSKEVKLTITKENGKILIKGFTTLGLKELQLPDPSIAIAKVRDIFDLSFVILL